tara:strand:+ start:3005 stop:3313 length:309 start_codon:yes stop_codon:yes gene_type:complete
MGISETQRLIIQECDSVKELLLRKNQEYGDSAVHPKRIFSQAHPVEQIKVRIDDKLSRLMSDSVKTIQEDTVQDLIGYLILMRVAERVHSERDEQGQPESSE